MSVEVTREHVDVATACAWKFCRRLPPGADTDAFHGAALEALAVTATKWDGHGDFMRYMVGQVWYAMLDEARRLSPNSRSVGRQMARGEVPVVNGRETHPVRIDSLAAPIVPGGDGGHLTLADTLADPEDEYAEADARMDRQSAARQLRDRDRFLVMARAYGFTGDELAEAFGITPSRISQIQTAAARLVA